MQKFREKLTNISVNYLNILVFFYIMSTCYNIKGFDYLYITALYAVTAFICYLFCYFVENNYTKIIIILFIAGISAIYILANRASVMDWSNNYFIASLDSINNDIASFGYTRFISYHPILIFLIPLITVCLYFLYDIGAKSAVQLLLTAEIIMFWYLQYYEEVVRCLMPFIAVSAFTLLINNYKKLISHLERKKLIISINRSMFIASVTALSIMISIITVMIPNKVKPGYGDSIIDSINGKETSKITSKSTAFTERYGLDYSGYSNTEQKLGGPIKLDNSVAFKVQSDEPYYLVGDVKDVYTGSTWTKSQIKYSKGSNMQSYYQNQSVQKGYANNLFDDVNKKTLTIIPEALITTTIFVPKYPLNVINNQGTAFYNDEDETFLSTKPLSKSYMVDFYDVDLSRLSTGGINSYNDEVYSRYLELPQSVSQRTVDLVYSIVKDCSTNEEKVKAIRDYLSKNYKYTLDASELPNGKDFVDYFLFEDKKGYCVYFASAMAVMYRIAGIPARFAEGFKMSADTDNKGVYEVKNSQAHAWCEYMVKPNVWEISDASPTPEENSKQNQKEENSNDPVKQQPQEDNKPKNTPAPSAQVKTPQKVQTEAIANKTDNKFIAYSSATIFIILALLLITLLQNRRKSDMFRDKSSIKLYKYAERRLRSYRIIKEDYITDKEFIKTLPRQLFITLEPLVEAVYEEFYGGMPKESLDKKHIYVELERYLRQESESRLHYVLKKLFVLIRRLR